MVFQNWLFAILFFFMTISKSLKTIPLVLTILLIVLEKDFLIKFKRLLSKVWLQAIIVMIVLAGFEIFVGPAALSIKKKYFMSYLKLLYIPIFVIGFQENEIRKKYAINGFLSGIGLTVLISIVKFLHADPMADSVFYNHIITSIMVSFAVMLCINLYQTCLDTLCNKAYKRLLIVLAFLATFQLFFINQGRTGQILFIILMSVQLISNFLNKDNHYIIYVIIFIIIALSFIFHAAAQKGLEVALSNMIHFSKNPNTSVGFRLQFHEYAKLLFLKHPFLGNGLASYSTLFYQDNPVPMFGRIINEPHSSYWLIAVELGIIGILALITFMYSAVWEICCKNKKHLPLAVSFCIIFVLCNFSDSLLFYSESSLFFILFLGFLLS